jgi:hypothetical protein
VVCRCGRLAFGELEALSFEGEFRVITARAASAQDAAVAVLEVGDAGTGFVGRALRVCARGVGGVELVGEVLRVVADLPAHVRQRGAQLLDGDPSKFDRRELRAGCGVAVANGGGRAAVDSVEGEVFVVAAAHGGVEAFERCSRVAEFGGVVGGDLGSGELVLGWGVDEEDLGCLAGA